ncbi:hypothetical protein Rs2_02940 [Raphanus sativus]|nr:hypothetical protein Rs2_02940 [Raphanus sativus]
MNMNEYKLHRRKNDMQENCREESPWRREGTRTLLTVDTKSRGEESPWRREPSKGIAVEKRKIEMTGIVVERNRRGEEEPWRGRAVENRREPSREIRGEEEPSKGRAVESWIHPMNRLRERTRETRNNERQNELPKSILPYRFLISHSQRATLLIRTTKKTSKLSGVLRFMEPFSFKLNRLIPKISCEGRR